MKKIRKLATGHSRDYLVTIGSLGYLKLVKSDMYPKFLKINFVVVVRHSADGVLPMARSKIEYTCHKKEGSLQLRCNWGPRIKRISLQYHMSHHAPSDPKPWLLFQANTYTQWVVQYCVHHCGSGP